MVSDNSHNPAEEVRIGFFICHCGVNIASKIDVAEVAKFAETLPGVVVSRDYKYMCSDAGQDLIVEDIKNFRLNRIVVAACSPFLHEKTFRTATQRGGINPFLCHMVNIREHGSWVAEDRVTATEKAKAMAQGGVGRVRRHVALEKRREPVLQSVLVVGGGIAGIQAALTLANAGKHVYLVEREPTIGGHMAQFDKTFPTLDCAACILTPKMSEVGSHPNITLWAYSEVIHSEGYVGNYKVKVRRKARYINEDECTGCMECVEHCSFKTGVVDDEFNVGLVKRKPVYMSFPQAVPKIVVIDPLTCAKLSGGKCEESCIPACDRQALDFTQTERVEEIEVGAIIVATGFKTFDAKRKPYYGYGDFPNVYTSLEIERMVTSSGPTEGEVVCRDGRVPKSVGIVHCVGSRDHQTNRWCSRVCCMASLKLAYLLKEHTGAEIYNFYIDMRTPGKGYEEFYERLLEEGNHFIRGRVAEVTDFAMRPEEENHLIIQVEDTLSGYVRRVPVDMVVLAVGIEPQADASVVRRLFNISCSDEGFFLERHPKLAPVSTATEGVYLAGCCQGPRDIPDTVAQAGAAAAEALALLDPGFVEMEPMTAYVENELCSGCKTCQTMCPYGAISNDAERKIAVINPMLCKGCGTCVASCPSGAIHQNLFDDQELFDEIQEVLAHA
ncbi:MAG: CoB--CoM heterodisulfide reductase iron-sulfur subunit A family protein [Armatimonadetes bacterium]|nr:CoB--CoM heterodisulfide reductase iron-sulfur subunit A family protein [Armatimonadota bacterium]